MRNKILVGLGIIIGLVVLGGIFGGSSKPQVAGTQIEVTPSPTIVATPTPTVTPTPSPTPTPTPTPQPTIQPATQSNTDSGLSNDNTYVNSNGNTVHSPAYSNTTPSGATAICGDGTYSFSQHRQGTCSHHGGVTQWL